MRHGSDPTPRVRALNPSVPVVLDEIVAKAMDKEPAARYASASELANDLRLVQDALRFGRTLTWPLRTNAAAPAPPAKTVAAARTPKAASPGRVAPRMSAIREDDEDYGRPERDVPAWASVGLALTACVAVSMVAVYFVLNLNRPRMVSVPSVTHLTFEEARASFDKAKLTIKRGKEEPSYREAAGLVIDTDPPSETRVREGSAVTANLSAGPASVKVPRLEGMTTDQARSALEKLGLELGGDPKRVNVLKAKDDTIVEQDPKANAPLARGDAVKVTVQDDTLPKPVIHFYNYTLDVDLSELPERTRVKVELEDLNGRRVIEDRRRRPGDPLSVTAPGQGRRGDLAHLLR